MNDNQALRTPNDRKTLEISHSQLPLHCPTADMSLWDSHPRVFLPIEESGQTTCPYCGTNFSLKND